MAEAAAQNTYETQLTEIELLQSMFPGESELVFDDCLMLTNVRRWVDGLRQADPKQISFTVTFSVTEVKVKFTSNVRIWVRSVKGGVRGK